MNIRSYSKQELAMLYFPDSDPRTATNHLMRWINRNQSLLRELHAAGYYSHSKFFTTRQVCAIIDYLGDPWFPQIPTDELFFSTRMINYFSHRLHRFSPIFPPAHWIIHPRNLNGIKRIYLSTRMLFLNTNFTNSTNISIRTIGYHRTLKRRTNWSSPL